MIKATLGLTKLFLEFNDDIQYVNHDTVCNSPGHVKKVVCKIQLGGMNI